MKKAASLPELRCAGRSEWPFSSRAGSTREGMVRSHRSRSRSTSNQALTSPKKLTHSGVTRTRPRSIHAASRIAIAGRSAISSPTHQTTQPRGGRNRFTTYRKKRTNTFFWSTTSSLVTLPLPRLHGQRPRRLGSCAESYVCDGRSKRDSVEHRPARNEVESHISPEYQRDLLVTLR